MDLFSMIGHMAMVNPQLVPHIDLYAIGLHDGCSESSMSIDLYGYGPVYCAVSHWDNRADMQGITV